jgi:hypothetical protein
LLRQQLQLCFDELRALMVEAEAVHPA